jgi:uncharacterized repeat protein (TIGR01451 family)
VTSESIFDELPARAGADGGRTVAYTVRARNNSKHAVSGVKFLDVLPAGLEIERAWLSESARRAFAGGDRALFEVFRHEGRWAIVWGVTESLRPGEEVSITFGAVKR